MKDILFHGIDVVSADLGISEVALSVMFIALIMVALALKGFALWHAARNSQKYWFIGLLVINTLGILEIVYILWFRKDRSAGSTQSLFSSSAEQPSSTSA